MVRTFYDVLGIPESATVEEIESAYRERVKETHPDVTDDEDAHETVQRVIEARDVLTDEAERSKYDRLGHETYVGQTVHEPIDADSTAAEPSDSPEETVSTASDNSEWTNDTQTAADDWWQKHADQAAGGRTTPRGRTVGEHVAETNTERSSWTNGSGYAVRQPTASNELNWSRLFPGSQSAVLLLAAFICYPMLVVSSVFPSFPLVVNLVVSACTLLITIYLVSIPEVGTLAFGFWSLVTVGALALGHLDPFSIAGVLAMTVTWVPLVLSLAVFALVRP
ncbi:DnaJ domain-containing protein [Halorhabdus salina]|uniref:DnaJ domain-containing protein n=1 Tax=Halorhabdus salina TaxID=2750670 RepID=UPI0015EEB541|nr:DnaJ domain-containing protein [Halorhabdus salina]